MIPLVERLLVDTFNPEVVYVVLKTLLTFTEPK